MTSATQKDPRRRKAIKISWRGQIGQLWIDDELWGAVEWSDKRKAWCIEDSEGRCLSHHSHVRGEDKDKASAVALAEAMIRDGRMPTPEAATAARKERLKADRERKAKQPAEIKRRAARKENDRLWRDHYQAEREDKNAEEDAPLYEAFADSVDLTDPDLWRSNSFAAVRDRLLISVKAGIARLEYEKLITYGPADEAARVARLNRAREILAQLQATPSTAMTLS
jgi:hypothetical protein